MSSPSVILKSKFIGSGSKQFRSFIEYIDRDNAQLNINIDLEDTDNESFNMYHKFMDYMGDEEKEGNLFTSNNHTLDKEGIKKIKKDFSTAQKNNSPLWQDVISFDNEWLEEIGIYNSDEHTVKEEKIQIVVENVMDNIIEKENMLSPIWVSSIHYNTDNIHVHVASAELDPSHREKVEVWNEEKKEYVQEYRAKRKQSTLDMSKSIVVGNLKNRNKQYEKLDSLVREPSKQKKNIALVNKNNEMKNLFNNAIENMPDSMKEWKYGYNSVDSARPYIDEIGERYLDEYHPEEYKELITELDKENELRENLYGKLNQSKDSYKDMKLDELKRSLGNSVIDEMKDYKKELSAIDKKTKNMKYPINNNLKKQNIFDDSLRNLSTLRYSLRKTKQQMNQERANLQEFDQMLEKE